jgi:nicotinate-nucleotide pyrophosphorylase (carboxylating)
MSLDFKKIDPLLKAALREDGASDDITTKATVSSKARAEARLLARQAGVAAGLGVFKRVFELFDSGLKVKLLLRDGARFKPGQKLAVLKGPAASMLTAERVALNFLQRLSGIATLTSRFVAEARGTRTKILDTRKTTPGLRLLEKYAVACGGGFNHRFGLADAVLIKDNHLRLSGSASEAVQRARAKSGKRLIEVEVENLAELRDALRSRPDIVLLDNLRGAALKQALKLCSASRSKVLTEVSGGIKVREVRGLAKLGVDRISVGALTHSAPALDLSLEFLS